MKKILFIIGNLGSGGAERQMTTIAVLLKQKGYDVSFVCWEDLDFYSKTLERNGIPVHWDIAKKRTALSQKRWIPLFFIKIASYLKVVRYIKQNHGDVAISFLKLPNGLNLLAARNKHWKVITGLRGIPDFPWGKFEFIANLQKRTDYLLSNSNTAMEVWLETFPQHKDKFKVIYNTVHLGPVDSTYTIRRDGKTHFVIAASFRKSKNVMNVLEAVSLMTHDEKSKLHIDWYGSSKGPDYQPAVDFIRQHHLSDVFVIHEATNDIASKMNEADFVALLSKTEGLPNAICEGMTLGKPIVMTKVSDYSVFVDHDNGFLCDWDNPSNIRKTLMNACYLPTDDMLQMGQVSKEKARKLFSNDTIVEQWCKMIES